MVSLTDIETRARHLAVALRHPDYFWLPLLELDRLLADLQQTSLPAMPFLLHLIDDLPSLAKLQSFVGLSPQRLSTLLQHLDDLHLDPLFKEESTLSVFTQELRLALVTLYSFVGETDQIHPILSSVEGIGAGTVPPAMKHSGCDSLQEFGVLAEDLAGQHHPLGAALKQRGLEWKAALRPQPNQAWFPGVEKPFDEQGTRTPVGQLCRLDLNLENTTASADQIRVDARFFDQPQAKTEQQAHIAMEVARHMLARTHPELARLHVKGSVSIQANQKMHAGASYLLGLAVLLYCNVVHRAEARNQVRIAPGVAFTGTLNAEGRVLPVETETLKQKVEAAFFSWVDTLVVPREQLETAETCAGALADAFPNKTLTLVGVREVSEVLDNRRVIDRKWVSVVPHYTRRMWKRRYSVGSLLTILTLVLVIGRLLYGPLDKYPINTHFEETSLQLLNAQGQVIEKIPVNRLTSKKGQLISPGEQMVQLFDIGGDGRNEVIWVERESHSDPINRVHCKFIGEDTFRWSYDLRKNLIFPEKPETRSDLFRIQTILVDDFDSDGDGEVIVVGFQYGFFPALVVRLDAATGTEEAAYVHTGWFSGGVSKDLDGDGIKEILLNGVNNALKRAVLVVLDPRFIDGHSPLQPPYQLDHIAKGMERYYVKFPSTVVGNYLRFRSRVPDATRIVLQESSIRVHVKDFVLTDVRKDEPEMGEYIIDFTHELLPVSAGTSTSYDNMATKLIQDGILKEELDKAYFDNFLAEIEYWNGEAWVKGQPVMNRRYIEAVGSMPAH